MTSSNMIQFEKMSGSRFDIHMPFEFGGIGIRKMQKGGSLNHIDYELLSEGLSTAFI